MPPRLLAAISAHGFGHLGQMAPLLNALHRRLPGLELTVRTALPEAGVAARIDGPFEYHGAADDIGMVQHSAFEVDVERSAAAYAELHRDWPARVAEVARELDRVAPDLVLADIPPLTLAGAQAAGIPAVALCCINWVDIYRHYCGARPEAPAILDEMQAAYAGAELFLQPTPSMPMENLPNRRPIGPLALVGEAGRLPRGGPGALGRRYRVMVALGGIETALDLSRWPRHPEIGWIVSRRNLPSGAPLRADLAVLEELGLDFADLLAGCDALLTKPGYGSFAEAAAVGLPVLYLPRRDWPEQPYLVEWLERRGGVTRLAPEALADGRLFRALLPLLEAGRLVPVPPSGIDEAVALIVPRLTGPSAPAGAR